jgi:transcriptional regulator NrdR family protein
MEEQVYGTMDCPCCDGQAQILHSETEQDGDIIIVSYYGKCSRCNTTFGTKEWYRRTDWDWIGENEAKKVLDKLNIL